MTMSLADAFAMKAQQDRMDSLQQDALERYINGDFAQAHLRGIIQLLQMLEQDIAIVTRCGHEDWDVLHSEELDTAHTALKKLIVKGGD